jgi:hypothetical protein
MLRKTVSDGELIVRSREQAEAAWRIASGTVVVRGPGPDGQERETVADAGDVIGAVAVLAGARYDQTAAAQGNVVLEMLPRDELVTLLAASPDQAGRMLDTVFRVAEEVTMSPAFDPPPLASPQRQNVGAGAAMVRLYGAEPALAGALGADGVAVDSVPFIVGRKESTDDDSLGRGVHLALADSRPFHLSRRHFAIERNAQGWLARDCGSYHGTFVNGVLIGAAEQSRTARLNPGENEIIAGALSSPFRFRLTLG